MVDMKSDHVQLDELKINMKGVLNQWLWVAIDAKSKVLLSLQVGPRKQWVAHALVHSLVAIMAPGYVPLYTSDGLAMYFYALTAHYGSYQELEGKRKPHWVVSEFLQYAQMKKHRVWRKLKRIEIRVLCGERDAINDRLVSMGLRATVQTSFVERCRTGSCLFCLAKRRAFSLNPHSAPKCGRFSAQNVVAECDGIGVGDPSILVSSLLPFLSRTSIIADGVHRLRSSRQTTSALPPAHAGHGGGLDSVIAGACLS